MAGMNAGIILAGARPDFVNVLRQSTAGAAEAVANQRNNALNQLYQEQGAGIVAGDQNALNALAQHSPQAALGVRGAQQDLEAGQLSMDATRQRMDVLNSQERRAVEEHAAKMSAAERAQEAQQIGKGLMQGVQFYQAGDLPRLNALLQSVGDQPLQSLDQFPAVAVKYKGVLDALKSVKDFNKEPKREISEDVNGIKRFVYTGEQVFEGVAKTPDAPLSPQGKLAADLEAGRISPEQFNAANQKSGMRVTSDGDGGFTFEQGPGVTQGSNLGKKATNEIEGKEIGAREGLARLDRINQNLIDNPEIIEAQTLQGQIKAKGLAWKDYITGDLSDAEAEQLVNITEMRADVLENVNFTIKEITGAAMTDSEAKRIGATLPNVTDSPTVFKAKLDRSINATRMAIARYNYWRSNGLEGDPSDVSPLGEMRDLITTRAKEIYAEELEAGDPATARDRTRARLAGEFGIE